MAPFRVPVLMAECRVSVLGSTSMVQGSIPHNSTRALEESSAPREHSEGCLDSSDPNATPGGRGFGFRV